mmetsp:Transcript_16026/g.48124  ORF Transcript_16026/g.48124 Transcript_16026/m.48124 type:complete len:467 (+) Transcript_16026:1015-2415(+)
MVEMIFRLPQRLRVGAAELYGPGQQDVHLLVGLARLEELVAHVEEDRLRLRGQLLEADRVVPQPGEKRGLGQDAAVDVVAELGPQVRRQLMLDLLLVHLEALVGVPDEDQVLPDAVEELRGHGPEAHVAAEDDLLLALHVRVVLHLSDDVRQRPGQACVDHRGHEEQNQHEERLLEVLGGHVSVAHGRHGGQGEVEGVDVALELLRLLPPVANVVLHPGVVAGVIHVPHANGVPDARRPVRDAEEQEQHPRDADDRREALAGLGDDVHLVGEVLDPEQPQQPREPEEPERPHEAEAPCEARLLGSVGVDPLPRDAGHHVWQEPGRHVPHGDPSGTHDQAIVRVDEAGGEADEDVEEEVGIDYRDPAQEGSLRHDVEGEVERHGVGLVDDEDEADEEPDDAQVALRVNNGDLGSLPVAAHGLPVERLPSRVNDMVRIIIVSAGCRRVATLKVGWRLMDQSLDDDLVQ